MSFRRDACDMDYPSKHYEKMLMPEEQYSVENDNLNHDLKNKVENPVNFVLMERSYLNGWTNFKNSSKELVDKHFDRLIEET